jgi:cytochrome P450 family 142 subfamily A polypeptide 1
VAEKTQRLVESAREQLAQVADGGFEPKGDHPLRDDIHLLDGGWYATDPQADWEWLREHAPAYYCPNADVWGVSRYEDIVFASRNPDIFSNHDNIRPKTGHVPMMISMDDPDHTRRRKIVNKGFTRRRVADKEERLRAVSDQLIDRMLEQDGQCDFVWTVAAWLPLIVIGDMLGVAPGDRDDLLRWSDLLLKGTEGDLEALDEATKAFGDYWAYQAKVVADRKANPKDDLVSLLAHAEVDGDRLDDESLIWESLLILIGGDETTRHVLSGGLLQLLTHPEAMEELRADLGKLPTAIEEMLRYVSPIKSMSRKVRSDVELGGQTIPAGDEVLLFYPSGNRDPRQFDAPQDFDIHRDPNHHIAFGHGTHFCLGANLARLELKCLFEQLLTRVTDLELAVPSADLELRRSSFTSGLEGLPIRYAPA